MNQKNLDRLKEVFGEQLDWLGPVYQNPDETGLRGLFCPFPNILAIKFTSSFNNKDNEFSQKLARYGMEEVTEKSNYLGEYHYYIINNIENVLPGGSRIQPERTYGTPQSIAKKVGISHATYERSKKIITKGSEDQKNALRKGDVRIKKIYGQLRREERRDELIQRAKFAPTIAQLLHNNQLKQSGNPNVQLYHSDFRLLTEQQIPSERVDLLFTEPPDDGDSLPLYQDLARFANKRLKVGGSLVTYVGNWAVPTVFDYMRSNNLQYWRIMSVKHTGGSARMHKYKVRVRWKPLLWFVKGPVGTHPTSMINDIHDFIVSKPPEDNKLVHEWEQSTVEASYIIENK